jgi:hypothetical protein
MIDPPRTRAEAEKRRYAYRVYRPEGLRFSPSRCAWEVFRLFDDDGEKVLLPGQCRHHPGHGPEGLYCRQHARKVQP